MNLDQWLNEARQVLNRLKQIDLGYPLGENALKLPATEEQLLELVRRTGLAKESQLLSFYSCCDGMSLPDVHVGYFIHSIDLVIRGVDRGEPVRVLDLTGKIPVLVFGSDGGGGRFALQLDGPDQVLYLPVGAVNDSTFDGVQTPVKDLASDFSSFLELLLADVSAFVDELPNWRYLV